MTDHGVDYIEGLLVGIKENQANADRWREKFTEQHEKDMEEIMDRMAAIEATMAHERATRAAWNKLIGTVATIATAATAFFSGALNRWFGGH